MASNPLNTPPSNIEAERYIIGSVLRDPDVLSGMHHIQAEDFYMEAYRRIFGTMQKLYADGFPVEIITISEAMDPEVFHAMDGHRLLSEALEEVLAPVNLDLYVKLVKNKSMLREVIRTCTKTIEGSYEAQVEAGDVIANVEHEIYKLGETGRTDSMRGMSELVPNTIRELAARYDNKGEITGISTGFLDLDHRINGLKPTDLVIIAARPGMGKTSFVLNIAEEIVTRDGGMPVVVFSLEMSGEQLMQRMFSSLVRVDSQSLARGNFSHEQWSEITAAGQKLEQAPLYVDDDAQISVQAMISKVRHIANKLRRDMRLAGKEVAENEQVLGCVVVDYLQLMTGNNRESREREISEISRGLKLMAKQLHVPVIALSQLNRGVEQRADKRPVMSDLRESGAIEQDADLIMFIYREDMYRKPADGEEEFEQDPQFQEIPTAEIIVGKNRHGPTGTIELLFDGRYTRFYNKAHDSDDDDGGFH